MSGTRITAPVDNFNGVGVGGVVFTDGVGESDDPAVLDYCRTAGYEVGGTVKAARQSSRTQPDPDADVTVS